MLLLLAIMIMTVQLLKRGYLTSSRPTYRALDDAD